MLVTDAPTVINLTNQGIFNPAGEGYPEGLQDMADHSGQSLHAADAGLIPDHELPGSPGTVFDFTHRRPINQVSATVMTHRSSRAGL